MMELDGFETLVRKVSNHTLSYFGTGVRDDFLDPFSNGVFSLNPSSTTVPPSSSVSVLPMPLTCDLLANVVQVEPINLRLRPRLLFPSEP